MQLRCSRKSRTRPDNKTNVARDAKEPPNVAETNKDSPFEYLAQISVNLCLLLEKLKYLHLSTPLPKSSPNGIDTTRTRSVSQTNQQEHEPVRSTIIEDRTTIMFDNDSRRDDAALCDQMAIMFRICFSVSKSK